MIQSHANLQFKTGNKLIKNNKFNKINSNKSTNFKITLQIDVITIFYA